MATLHGYVNTMRCACMDVDSFNCAGVYNTGDLDNGVFVTLGEMAQDAQKKATGFQFAVAPADNNTTVDKKVWLVASPEVGTTIDMQVLSDPRYFYNEKGQPMSLKHLVPGVDCIEVTKECFTAALPDGTTNKFATVGAGGKLTAAASDPGANKICLEFVAKHSVTIGMEEVPTVILRMVR